MGGLFCKDENIKCDKCIKNDEIYILEEEIRQLKIMIDLKDTKINILEKQIYLIEKYK